MEVQNENNGNFSNLFLLLSKQIEKISGTGNIIKSVSPSPGTILPEKDIDNSLNTKGALAYKAVVNNKIVGGAIVVINEETRHNELHFLYVKYERK